MLPPMSRFLTAGALAVLIAACTPTQQVQLSGAASGDGTVVSVDKVGIEPADAARLEQLLLSAGFIPAGSAATAKGEAKVVFAIGEARKSETVVEVPKYEQVQELRFINGRQRVFTEERFVGYERVHVRSTVFPSSAELVVRTGAESRTVRRVSTEGECGDPALLKPALIDVLLTPATPRSQEIELKGC